MIVCICHNVSERKLCQAVDAGMTSMPQLRANLKVGTCCGKCHPHAKQVLRERLGGVSGKLHGRVQPLPFQANASAA